MKRISEQLQAAREVDLNGLAGDDGVQAELELMHGLALSVCPDCFVKQRKDGALIYVPRERAHLPDGAQDKNLLTLWPQRRPLRLRMMFPKHPTPPKEAFDESLVGMYESRMRDLYREVLSVPKGPTNG